MERTGVRVRSNPRQAAPRVRYRVRWGRTAALLAAFLIPLGAHAAASAGDEHPVKAKTRAYVVQPGDTLWSIAERLAGPGADPRPLVDGIEDANGGSGIIVAGETLQLPA
jgi:Tfp pilus assembly protein FimV